MIKYLLNKPVDAMARRYNCDMRYLQDILRADLGAFARYMGFQSMASYNGKLDADVVYAARLRTILWDDCGPCTQLLVDMALAEDVSEKTVHGIINKDLADLPSNIAMVVEFADLVLDHNPLADELRQEIISIWGQHGLVTISFCIASTRVYPALKYAMGYGLSCQQINFSERFSQ